jgi:hypothetical protein
VARAVQARLVRLDLGAVGVELVLVVAAGHWKRRT